MNGNTNEILGRIVASGLQKCVDRLSRVSAGTWEIAGAEVSMGTLSEAITRHASDDGDSSAVYFDVKGELPFIAIMIFDPRDAERISKCLLGHYFFVSPTLSRTGELLLAELGNILLNSFVGALSNALKRIFMPSAPRCLKGGPQYLLEAMDISNEMLIPLAKVALNFSTKPAFLLPLYPRVFEMPPLENVSC